MEKETDNELGSEWHKAYPVPFGKEEQEERPYATKYCMIHGAWKMMSKEWGPPLKQYEDQEEVYKECLERGCTWEELLDFKGYDPDIVL